MFQIIAALIGLYLGKGDATGSPSPGPAVVTSDVNLGPVPNSSTFGLTPNLPGANTGAGPVYYQGNPSQVYTPAGGYSKDVATVINSQQPVSLVAKLPDSLGQLRVTSPSVAASSGNQGQVTITLNKSSVTLK